MSWELFGYAILCIIVPALWGLVVYRVSSSIEKRVLPQRPPSAQNGDEPTLPLDYHI